MHVFKPDPNPSVGTTLLFNGLALIPRAGMFLAVSIYRRFLVEKTHV